MAAVVVFFVVAVLVTRSHDAVRAELLRNVTYYANSGLNGLFDPRPDELENARAFLGDTTEIDQYDEQPDVDMAAAPRTTRSFSEASTATAAIADPANPAKFAFRIYSHNIRLKGELAKDEPPWEQRKHHVAASIKLHAQCLVVCLQEATAEQIGDLLQILNVNGDWSAVGKGLGPKGEHEPILFRRSEFELVAADTIYLNEKDVRRPIVGWDADTYSIATTATLRLRDVYVNVVNTRFRLGRDAKLELAKLLMERMGANRWPSFLVGDLNFPPTDKTHEQISRVYRDVHFQVPQYDRFGHPDYTVTGFLGRYLKEAKRVDYIFAPDYVVKSMDTEVCAEPHQPRLGLRVRGYGILHLKFGGTYMSNHRPVMAQFEIMPCR